MNSIPKIQDAQTRASAEFKQNYLLGYLRTFAATLDAIACSIVLTIIGLFPFRLRGVPLTSWVLIPFLRIVHWIFGVRIVVNNLHLLKEHRGIIVANHSSFLDASAFAHIRPVRYLAATEVRKRPMVGWVAKLIGTVFVTRDDLDSRSKASSEIVRALRELPEFPIVIFPEGRIGEGKPVDDFHRGGFWLAIKNEVPILPCAIEYDPEEVAIWSGQGDDSFTATLWPLVRYPGRIRATITPLEPIYPTPDDDPIRMAFDVRRKISQKIGFTE